MKGSDSLFSCMKAGDGQPADSRALEPQAPPSPPSATRQPDPAARVAVLEALVKQLEQDVPRLAAAEKRVAELETSLTELGGKVQLAAAACDGAVKTAGQGAAELRNGFSGLGARVAALEASLAKSREARPSSGPGTEDARLDGLTKFLTQEFESRVARVEEAAAGFAHKAAAAHEAAGAGLRRLEKIEERLARAAYVEIRLGSIEKKFEKFCECEAAVGGLRAGLENLEGTVHDVAHRAAAQAGEQKRSASEFESLSRQVSQLSSLFNHFRGELSFLMPGRAPRERE